MRNLVDRIEKIWCENMHGAPMWPMHGRYRCPKCLREYSVAFEGRTHEVPAPIVWSSAIRSAARLTD